MKKRRKTTRHLGVQSERLEARWVPAMTGSFGDGLPIDNVQPYNTLNYFIAVEGVFPSSNASIDPLIGSVELFAGTFAPRGWARCEGQLLSISGNTALFSILGTTYGGDGTDNFALPDLRGRVPIGASATHPLGSTTGTETITLTVDTLASHQHTVPDLPIAGTDVTGGSQPVENLQPSLALTPLISVDGVYPSSNLSLDDLLGSVGWFAGNFVPVGYEVANGQSLTISQNEALFSLIGTTYGGDGVTTFALPDLRGRTVIGAGTKHVVGETGGTETITLGAENLPAHSHSVPGSPPTSTGSTGSGLPVDNHQPFLTLNYLIAPVGIYPSQPLDTSDSNASGDNSVGAGFVSGNVVLDEGVARPLIQQLFQRGIELWQATGIDQDQISILESARFEIADLAPKQLAFAGENHVITLDRDASNRGWFIDATPQDDLEFGSVDPRTSELLATDAAVVGHFDLLTAILHEQGHLLGFDHANVPGTIMYGGLSTGGRLLPSSSDLVTAAQPTSAPQALEVSDAFIASIGMFAGNFTPRNWLETRGQLLETADNTALFSLLGITYGGDGSTTFAVPNLMDRAVIGAGSGYVLGQQGGSAAISLTQAQLPAHTHTFEVSEPPTATNLNAAESYTEDTPLNLTNIVVSDVDSTTVTVVLTLSNPAVGSLNTATSGAVASTYVAGTGVWTATGAIADVNTLLAGLVFTPSLNFNSSFSVTTSVTDGVVIPVTGTKVFSGTAVDDAPIAGDDIRPTLIKGGPNGTVNILANDTDGEGNPTAPVNGTGQFKIDLNPSLAGIQTTFTDSHGAWTLDPSTGVVTFSPAVNFIGSASIPYTLTDPTGLSDTGNITFAVLLKNTNLIPASVVSGSSTTGNNSSADGSISADGRFTVFTSTATNLVDGQTDTPDTVDVFLFDYQTTSVTMISRQAGSLATAANGESGYAVISADGRFVVYKSSATNLFSGQTDTNNGDDIFLYDRESGTTQLVSRADGTTNTTANHISGSTTFMPGASAISANGRFIAFVSFANNLVAGMDQVTRANVFLFDAQENTMQLVSHAVASATTAAAGYSLNPVLSADGRFVAYTSEAGDLVVGQTDHSVWDVFLFDRNLASNSNILVSGLGGSATETGHGESFSDLELAISEDGRFVAFKSFADDLVPGVVDENHNSDIFLFDRDANGVRTTLVSHSKDSLTTAATGGSASSEKPVMSHDGRFVAYQSTATNIVANDSNNAYDIFLFDRVTRSNALVSHANGSTATANGASTNPIISSDSTNDNVVVYNSTATNLVAGQGDLNGLDDVFIYSRINFNNILASGAAGSAITAGNGASSSAAVSSDGSAVAITSLASNLGGTDSNNVQDVFVRGTLVPTFPKISFRAQSFTTRENGGTARIRVDRSGDTAVSAGVDYRVFTGSGIDAATAGSDFVADEGTLIFAPGETTLTFDVVINDDTLTESDEYISLELLAPSPGTELGTDSFATIKIQDDDGLGLISINSSGTATGNSGSHGATTIGPMVSFDGRLVAFESTATDLVDGITYAGPGNVYVRDRLTGETILVSRNAQGTGTGDGVSILRGISPNGVFVLFASTSTNLVANTVDNNDGYDLFLFNVLTRTTTLVSSLANNPLVTGNGSALDGAVSDDGRFVTFTSEATNLISGIADNNHDHFRQNEPGTDIFFRDLLTGTTTLLSRNANANSTGNDSSSDPQISADGQYVAFRSFASNLTSGNNDTNHHSDVFIWDRLAQVESALTLVSLNADGTVSANGDSDAYNLRRDGRAIAFRSAASDLIAGTVDDNESKDIFFQDLATGERRLVSHAASSSITTGNHQSFRPQFSGNGRYIGFRSYASNLASNVPDFPEFFFKDLVYRYNTDTGAVELVSVSSDETNLMYTGITFSDGYSISADGRFFAFESDTDAGLLFEEVTDVNQDLTLNHDVYLRDMLSGTTTLISRTATTTGNFESDEATVSGNGQFVFFKSGASNLVPENDANNPPNDYRTDIFVSPGQFNPGIFQFGDTEVDVSENGTEAIVTVNRTGGSNGTFVFTVATRASSPTNGADKVATPNVDFFSQNRTLFFEDGQTTATIRIPIVDDGADEKNETFEVRLTDSSGLSLLGANTTAVVTIVDDDTTITGNRVVEDDGDVVTITLKGSGTLSINLLDPDGNGKGPIQLNLAGTNVGSSSLSFKVTKGPNGDGFANVAQITGNGGLKSLAGKLVNLTGAGLDLDGTVLSLALHDLVNGADISLGGQASDFIKLALHDTTNGSTIDVHSGIKTLTANRIFRTEINALRGLDTITVGRLIGSSIYASFTPTTKNTPLTGGTFTAAVAIKKVTVKGISGEGAAFSDSVLAAAMIGSVSLASYDLSTLPGLFGDYGIIANLSIDKVTSKNPKLTYDPNGSADQVSGRFHIKRI